MTVNTGMFDYVWGVVFRDIDITRGLEKLDRPVFLALGRHDYLVPPPSAWEPLGTAFRDLTIRVFEKSGHTPQLEEQELCANYGFQFGALAGPDVMGFKVPPPPRLEKIPQDEFVDILNQLPKELNALPDNEVVHDYYLCCRCLGDIWEVLEERLSFHGISMHEFMALQERLYEFVQLVPSRRIDMHMMRQYGKNPQLPRKQSDLNDFGYLGYAAAYCDVVVAEKQFADLVNRGTLEKKAIVISKLRDLPGV